MKIINTFILEKIFFQEQSFTAKCSVIKEEPMNTSFASDEVVVEEQSKNSADSYENFDCQNPSFFPGG